MDTNNISPLMTASEFEDLIQRPRGTVKQWVCRHQMPLSYLKIRGRIMLRRETVAEWLANEIPAFQKPPKEPEIARTAGTLPRKRRGRPPKVMDMAREAHA